MLSRRKPRPTLASRFPALQSRWVPLAILLGGIAGTIAIHTGWLRFTMRPANEFLVLVVATNFLVYGWIRGFSQWQINGQIIAVTLLVAAQAAVHQAVRLDGFAGDGRPIWVWRWIPEPETVFAESQHGLPEPTESVAATDVDLVTTQETDFPSFRGIDRSGCVTGPELATNWEANPPRLLWKQPIGAGWSSFAIVGDYCVTQEQRGEFEATVCYELRTGLECWAHTEQARFEEVTSSVGPRATPTIHVGCVYSLGATGILNCLEGSTGKPRWTVDVLKDNNAPNLLFGVTASPLVVGSQVIVNPGGKGSSLAAYDGESGARLWRAGTSGASYSSPQLATLCGREQVLDFNADGLAAHDLATGELLWSVPWISNPAERNNVCQPIPLPGFQESGDCVFLASGYGMGCTLLEITQSQGKYAVNERWRNRNLKPKFSSVVLHEGHVYGLDDAILTCVEVATGKRCWKGGRYNFGQLIRAGSLLLVQLESGEIALVRASPAAFQELARFPALDNRTWNHPALAGRVLVVRNDREAAAFELPASADSTAFND